MKDLSKTEFNQLWAECYRIWGPSGSNTFNQTQSNSLAGVVKKYLYPPGKVRILGGPFSLQENIGTINIQTDRFDGGYGPASVKVSTKNGTALAGIDYVAKSETVSWSDGEIGPKNVSINILDDTTFENNETKTFTVELSNPVGVTLDNPKSVIINVTDNEVNVPETELPAPNNNQFITTPHDKITNFGANPTIWSIKSGNWSDVTIWNLGRLPNQDDIVSITGTTSVVFDTISICKCLTIQDLGKLSFKQDTNTELKVTHFMVLEGGTLEQGTSANPIQTGKTCKVIFRDIPINTTIDPFQHGNGLLCFGKWTACGCGSGIPKTFIRLAANPSVGHTSLLLQNPAEGWNIGDEIVIPDTHQLTWWEKLDGWGFTKQDEVVKITGISQNKFTITIDRPLTYNHTGHLEDGQPTVFAHVGLLTRNLLFVSENPQGTRGHTFATMGAEVDICHAQFKDLGRTTNDVLHSTEFNQDGSIRQIGTNQIGRYPVHLHHAHGKVHTHQIFGHSESDRQFKVDGVCVQGSTKWGIVIHASHHGEVSNSVVYDAKGAGLVTEDGSESYNIIEDNFVCKVWGVGERDSEGRDGIGFWFRGPNNYVRRNIACNIYPGPYCYGFSFNFRYLGNKDIPISKGSIQMTSVNMNTVPLLEFADNELYASSSALTCWWLGTFEDSPFPDAIAGIIKNFKFWHVCSWGYFGYATQRLTIDGYWGRGDTTNIDTDNRASLGIWFSDYYQKDLTIKNADIKGFSIGIACPTTAEGNMLIENCLLKNVKDITTGNGWSVGGGLVAKPWHLQVNNCVVEPDVNDRYGSSYYIQKTYTIADSYNGIELNSTQVSGFNVSGNNPINFNLYVPEQVSTFIVPSNGSNLNNPYRPFIGSPIPGLTNAESLSQQGICVNAQIAPDNCVQISGVYGICEVF